MLSWKITLVLYDQCPGQTGGEKLRETEGNDLCVYVGVGVQLMRVRIIHFQSEKTAPTSMTHSTGTRSGTKPKRRYMLCYRHLSQTYNNHNCNSDHSNL